MVGFASGGGGNKKNDGLPQYSFEVKQYLVRAILGLTRAPTQTSAGTSGSYLTCRRGVISGLEFAPVTLEHRKRPVVPTPVLDAN